MKARRGQLAGKVAIVTGGTQGLGGAIAERFAREGARVMVIGRSKARAEKMVAVLNRLGTEAAAEVGDLQAVDTCRRLIQATVDRFGRIDVIVNSAALTDRSSLDTFTPELFDAQFRINVRAPLLLAQSALPWLRRSRGAILNIGSINAYVGWPNLLLYSATKGALMTASRNLANGLKYERVRVHCLNLGWTDTDGERVVIAGLGLPPDFLDQAGKDRPMGRLIQPEEVAEICLLLASDKAAVFSGCVIDLEQYPLGTLHDPSPDRNAQFDKVATRAPRRRSKKPRS